MVKCSPNSDALSPLNRREPLHQAKINHEVAFCQISEIEDAQSKQGTMHVPRILFLCQQARVACGWGPNSKNTARGYALKQVGS